MLEGKKILVTAGGTSEYIDDVRVMTNTSTGELGSIIAEKFIWKGAFVHFVHGIHSKLPHEELMKHHGVAYPIFSAWEARETMRRIIIKERIDAVIHSMAVSDFTFERSKPVKCKSNDPEGFIEFMRATITPNPKIISEIKQWRPETLLIGFKYEVGVSVKKLIELAQASIEKNGCDAVVINDKKEMDKEGIHVARLVPSKSVMDKVRMQFSYQFPKMRGKDDIAEKIRNFCWDML